MSNNLTPKEKAEELRKIYVEHTISVYYSKKYALIAVNEILFVVSKYNDTQAEVTYWQEVKKELEILYLIKQFK